MRRNSVLATVIFSLLLAILFGGCGNKQQKIVFQSVTGKTHAAVIPVEQKAEWAQSWWMPRHNAVNDRLKQGSVDLLYIGDSITHNWEKSGKDVWTEYYANRNAVNMGFGGDQTQHVLWRLEHSNFEGLSPKLAILMIGTNNSNRDDFTAEEIADGIIAICRQLRNTFPDMKILLQAIFPRGPKPSPQREKNAKASLLASKIADNKMIYYVDFTEKFLEEDGTLSPEIMPDYLHPNEKGYKIWAGAIENKVAELMGEKKPDKI